MARAGEGKTTCCSCLCGFLFSAGVAVLIYWATFQPHRIRATVDSADLSNLTVAAVDKRINGTDGGVVYYRLAVNLTLRNPSGRVGVYYDAVDARLLLLLHGGASSLGDANLTSPNVFHQPRMSYTAVEVEFDRSTGGGVDVAGDVAADLDGEIKQGEIGFEVALDARVRYKLGAVVIRARPRVRCPMRIPVKAERRRRGVGVGGVLSHGGRCTVQY